jgi:hypothetical protein
MSSSLSNTIVSARVSAPYVNPANPARIGGKVRSESVGDTVNTPA